jgi:quercetin dioxygenase-like cupin family protein
MSVNGIEDVPPLRITKVGNVVPTGEAERRTLVSGKDAMLVRIEFKKGYVVPMHKHQESVGYVVRGKLKMKIGTKEFMLSKGSAWVHPSGVDHMTEALEDSEVLEIFSPPRPEWVQNGTYVLK